MSTSCIGHIKEKELISGLIEADKLPHAILITGNKGIGKAAFAEDLAYHLIAPKQGELLGHDAFHTNILQIEQGAYPHYFELKPDEGKKSISVDQVRKVISEFKYAHNEWQVLIIDSVDDLNLNGANALLKTLEEPSAKTLIVLISHQPYGLLPTIKSRCQVIHLQNLSDEDTKAVLGAQDLTINEALEDALKLSQGAPGEAIKILEEEMPIYANLHKFLDAYLQGKTQAAEAEKIINRNQALIAYKGLQYLVHATANKSAVSRLPSAMQDLMKYLDSSKTLEAANLYQKLEQMRQESDIYNISPPLLLEKALGEFSELIKS